MANVIEERMTERVEGAFVVFLMECGSTASGSSTNGFRLRWRHLECFVSCRRTRPVATWGLNPGSGIPPYLNPTILLQYWRSFDDLERYAKNPYREHRPAWVAFNRAIGSRGDVGILFGSRRTSSIWETSNAFITTCKRSD
jgi:Domain of unknown function (DUF4188)